jgi:hypothetical protein
MGRFKHLDYNPYGSGVKYFVADFYCDIKKTVIELDGPIIKCSRMGKFLNI